MANTSQDRSTLLQFLEEHGECSLAVLQANFPKVSNLETLLDQLEHSQAVHIAVLRDATYYSIIK